MRFLESAISPLTTSCFECWKVTTAEDGIIPEEDARNLFRIDAVARAGSETDTIVIGG
jgi:hypothetical protein